MSTEEGRPEAAGDLEAGHQMPGPSGRAKALMTKMKRPSVSSVTGRGKEMSSGRSRALMRPSTKATQQGSGRRLATDGSGYHGGARGDQGSPALMPRAARSLHAGLSSFGCRPFRQNGGQGR